jgi:hypothetical protein
VTAREIDVALILSIAMIGVGLVALAGWPSFLCWRRRPKPVRVIERVR